jgi:hypothetical protein
MKYVMFTNVKTGQRLPVIFPDFLTHRDMRAGADWKPTSAGFFNGLTEKPYGKSETLKLRSREDDAELIIATLTNSNAIILFAQDEEGELEKLKVAQEAPAPVPVVINRCPTCGLGYTDAERAMACCEENFR